MKKYDHILILIFFISIFALFSNGRITTSMDVDVLQTANHFVDTGSYGSDVKLSSGVTYSPKTERFYPQEGIGVVMPLVITSFLSKSFGFNDGFLIYLTNGILFSVTLMFFYMTLKLHLPKKKALLYTLLLGLATPVFVHSKYLLPEAVTSLAFMGAIFYFFNWKISKKSCKLFLSGIFVGFSLLVRPDAPIFYLIFTGLALFIAFKHDKDNFKRHAIAYLVGLFIFSSIFAITNYTRYGSITESGYTLTRDAQIEGLQRELPPLYAEAKKLSETDKDAPDTQMLVQEFMSKQRFLEDLEKAKKEHGSTPKTIATNSIGNYFYGLYLIIVNPNRSILFISPVLLFIFLGFKGFWREFKYESIGFLLILVAYFSLYALRAPLSYAGSAAWGVRYLLPTYFIFSLLFIGFEKNSGFNNSLKRYLFIALFGLSFVYQIIGSAVNYQSVQMPLEYACKYKYGDKDMTWARESRKLLMTAPSASLLINNLQIMSGGYPSSLNSFDIPEELYSQLENAFIGDVVPNDWLFYEAITGQKGRLSKGRDLSGYNGIFMLFLILTGLSVYLIYSNVMKKED